MKKIIEFRGTNREFIQFLKTLVGEEPEQKSKTVDAEDIRKLILELLREDRKQLKRYKQEGNKEMQLYVLGKMDSLNYIMGFIDIAEILVREQKRRVYYGKVQL